MAYQAVPSLGESLFLAVYCMYVEKWNILKQTKIQMETNWLWIFWDLKTCRRLERPISDLEVERCPALDDFF